MADQSVTVNSNVVVHGRALARIAAVTLDDDRFFAPTCDTTGPPPPTPTPTTPGVGGNTGTGTTPTASNGGGTGTGTTGGGTATGLTNGVPGVSGPPRTGGAPLRSDGTFPWLAVLFVTLIVGVGATDFVVTRRAHARRVAPVGAHPRSER